MTHGSKESQNLFKAVYEDTGQHHPAFLSKPALRDDCIKYYDAFCLLSASRLWSEVGPQPIQLTEIESYLRMVGITDSYTKLKYVRLIRFLDYTHIEHINSQRDKAKQ